MASRTEFEIAVDGYEGAYLIGHREGFGSTTTFRAKLKNHKTAGRVPVGWEAHVVCLDEMQLVTNTAIGTVRLHEDCNQLGGEGP